MQLSSSTKTLVTLHRRIHPSFRMAYFFGKEAPFSHTSPLTFPYVFLLSLPRLL